MKEFEILVLKELLAKIKLERAKMEFGNDYVFGSDDVLRIIYQKINNLTPPQA